MERPFSHQEMRFVLAEAIKTSSLPNERILNFLNETGVQPEWNQMLLPHGRNIQSCMDAFESFRAASTPSVPHFPSMPIMHSVRTAAKRKSTSDIDQFTTNPAQKRRPLGMDTITARSIQPKPSSNGSPMAFSSIPATAPKKRGRPSKADVEQRQAEAIRRGEVLPPPKPSVPKTARKSAGAEAVTGGVPAVARILAPLPSYEQMGPPSPEESEKKRQPIARSRDARPGEGSFSMYDPPLPHAQKPRGESNIPPLRSMEVPVIGGVERPVPAQQAASTSIDPRSAIPSEPTRAQQTESKEPQTRPEA